MTDSQPGNVEEAVIRAVSEVHDGLGLPRRLCNINDISRDGLEGAAQLAYKDEFLHLGPVEFSPSVTRIEETLQNAW